MLLNLFIYKIKVTLPRKGKGVYIRPEPTHPNILLRVSGMVTMVTTPKKGIVELHYTSRLLPRWQGIIIHRISIAPPREGMYHTKRRRVSDQEKACIRPREGVYQTKRRRVSDQEKACIRPRPPFSHILHNGYHRYNVKDRHGRTESCITHLPPAPPPVRFVKDLQPCHCAQPCGER